ncbi:MAG TPA: hypothetical protein VFJ15_12040 [Oleiagrimonas sp.]|nr:hypothetical protein [Oleiagrimonas sp.]
MARGEHHRIHAQDRLQRNRCRVAQEAARLISEHGIHDYRRAKLKAAERLGVAADQALPRNREIEQALREHQRLFLADTQPRALQERREAACAAMRFFSGFQPRLVGAVLNGTADEHSSIQLHLFCDDTAAFARFLHEHDIPARQQSRRVRLDHRTEADFPVFLLTADGLPFDLTVMPHARLRQAPLDPVTERPTTRASLAVVETLPSADPTTIAPVTTSMPAAHASRRKYGSRRVSTRKRG